MGGGGRGGVPGHWSYVRESTLSIPDAFCGTQRARSLIDNEMIRQVGISATIAQGENLTLNGSSDWHPLERYKQRLCIVSPSL